MNKLLVSFIVGCLATGSLVAAPINVTVFDGVMHTHGGAQSGTMLEDQEADKGSFNQLFDLEAFTWDSKTSVLSLIGEFDFQNGVTEGLSTIRGGDIFLDLNVDGIFEHAIVLDFDNITYDLLSVTESDLELFTDIYREFANPFKVKEGQGTLVIGGIDFDFQQNLSDEEIGFGLIGGNHYKIDLDLGSAGITGSFKAQYTMQCANDLIIAQVPEPALLSMIGVSLISLCLISRRKKTN